MSTINIDLTGETLYSGNGQLDSNRTVDCNSNTILFDNNSVFVVTSNVAPSGLNGAWTVNGFGSGSQRVEKITSGAGTIRESFGDKSQVMYGKVSIGNDIGSAFLFEVDGTGTGKRGIYAISSGLIAIRGYDPSNVGIQGQTDYGIAVYGVASNTTAGYGGQFTGKFSLLSLPTSSAGLSAGDVWNDSGTLKIV